VGILLASGAIAGSADSHVTLTVEDSTAVPTETINFEGDSYEIDAIATRDQGDELTAHVTLPDKVFTDVSFLLYNSDQQIEASRGVSTAPVQTRQSPLRRILLHPEHTC